MLRVRRYRVFVIGAFVLVFLLFRVSQNAPQWEASRSAIYNSYAHPGTKDSKPLYSDEKSQPAQAALKDQKEPGGQVGPAPRPAPRPAPKPQHRAHVVAQKPPPSGGQHDDAPPSSPKVKIPELKPDPEGRRDSARPKPKPGSETPFNVAAPASAADASGTVPVTTPKPAFHADEIPDRDIGRGADGKQHPLKQDGSRLHIQDPPGEKQEPAASATSMTTVHWRKMPEHFPVAQQDVIPLPTGKPKVIPPVQHSFGRDEPAADRERREGRLAQVKREMQRAWNGYRKYAWGHDELEPVTRGFRDPFCGWAATLVDAMDTLWIMGMHDEFEDAYRALDDIDFTTTPHRREIPVFETIIRYLGGLLAAYDVSGGRDGKHPKLLVKAVELAEVLMSVFDTPNRMPTLYYLWDPAFASQPRRASTAAGVAELGSMSMEFTRLAQLTGENRYYDAIARITNAFEEWQNRGTALNGLFPEQVDASGCNRSAIVPTSLEMSSPAAKEQAAEAGLSADDPQGYSPVGSPDKGPTSNTKSGSTLDKDTEFVVHPADTPGAAAKAEFKSTRKLERRAAIPKKDTDSDQDEKPPAVPQPKPANLHPDRGSDATASSSPGPYGATGRLSDWDCVPQGLTDGGYGMGSYSMGGSQDSTYEYFPKQYILLGGLEPKYKTMHDKTVAAVKKYLLYRPMIKDEDRTLLFSAKVYARGSTDENLSYTYEMTHLTCFLGGMFALGGRIFGSVEDVAIGAGLADGCVWAYESMPSGLMPESAAVVPCQTVASCPWNETVWYEHLDPNSGWRESQLKEYEIGKKEWEQQRDAALKAAALRAKAEEEARRARPDKASDPLGRFDDDKQAPGREVTSDDFTYRQGKAYLTRVGRSASSGAGSASDAGTAAGAGEAKAKTGAPGPSILDGAGPALDNEQLPLGPLDAGSTDDPLMDLPPEPLKPQTHEEYVKQRIARENLPPGYTGITDRRYILRPEAIESVWYMYRITGDRKWQDKGWRMFQAVIKATRTEYGHSAVDGVDNPDSAPSLLDNMESFWMAETLKYFYLLFTTPDVISLDEWVLNTEAHPFKRPT